MLWINGTKVKGTIVARKSGISENDPYYYSVIKFETGEGKEILWEGGIGFSSPGCIKIGNVVTLRYPANRPEKAVLWTFPGLLFPSSAFFILAACTFVAAQHQ